MNVYYMNGAGNDFMVMDARGKSFDLEKLSRELCALKGADGFMAVDVSEKADFQTIYRWWKAYHLNGMKAGTPEQQEAVKEYNATHKYDYTAVCEYLKEKGLYEIPFYGKTVGKQYNGEMYRYGTGWCVEEIPESVLSDMVEFLNR